MNQDTPENVFTASFATYGDTIFRFCLVKVSHEALAEDMTQETFMRYWQYLRDGKEMINTRALLYTIANNLAKDWYKKKKSDSLEMKMETGYTPVAPGMTAETESMYHEVIDTINDLDTDDKIVLLLTHVEGLPPKDIALILGETANVISVRLNRATSRLQQKLGI